MENQFFVKLLDQPEDMTTWGFSDRLGLAPERAATLKVILVDTFLDVVNGNQKYEPAVILEQLSHHAQTANELAYISYKIGGALAIGKMRHAGNVTESNGQPDISSHNMD